MSLQLQRVKDTESKTLCCLYQQLLPSVDLRRYPCFVAVSIVCLTEYVDQIIQEDSKSIIRCPYPICEEALEPEFYSDEVPPNLFQRWSTVHRVATRRHAKVRTSNKTVTDEAPLTAERVTKISAVADKGKQPIESEQKVKQQIQLNDKRFYCKICSKWKDDRRKFSISQCPHVFCIECITSYLKVNIQGKVTSIKCPHPQCKDGILNRDLCDTFLSPVALGKWDVTSCEVAIGTSCYYCFRSLPSADVVKHSRCAVALCTGCLTRYVYRTLHEQTNSKFLIRCATCKASLEPELHRNIVPLNLFQRWTTAHHVAIQEDANIETSSKNVTDDAPVAKEMGTNIQVIVENEKQPLKSEKKVTKDIQLNDKRFYCTICLQWKHERRKFSISQCSHVFCRNCIISYLKVNIQDKATSIKCPHPQCKDGILTRELCDTFLSQTALEKWDVTLCEVAIGTKILHCPFNDCSAMLINDFNEGTSAEATNRHPKYVPMFFSVSPVGRAETSKTVLTNAECPHCHRMFCTVCKVPWHSGMSCKEFQTDFGDDENRKNDLKLKKLVLDKKWQRCPKCKMFVEKDG